MNLADIRDKLLRTYLCHTARPARISAHLHRQGMLQCDNCRVVDRRQVRVAALQTELRLATTPFAYADFIHSRVAAAAREGAQLVVFPEDTGLPLLGLLPGMMEKSRAPLEDTLSELGEGVTVADIFAYLSPVTGRVIRGTFPALAAGYGIYIMAGSFVVAQGEQVVNRSFLFGPDGSLIGSQDKVHLLPMEVEWGLNTGSDLPVYATNLGRLAIPVCMDATYFETFRILERKGAEIVTIGSADPNEYNYWLALRGIWPRVQESFVYGIKSCLVGELFGFKLTGKAGIFAPLELTPEKDGVLAQVKSFDKEGMALADLDLEALRQLKENHPWWGGFNVKLYERYFPGLYENLNR